MSAWSWQDVILYGPDWAACLMIPLMPFVDRWLERRLRRRYRERWGVDYDGPRSGILDLPFVAQQVG